MAVSVIPPPAVGDVYLVKPVISMGNQQAINALHFGVTAMAGAGASPEQIAQQMSVIFGNVYPTVLPPQATYNGVFVRRVKPTVTLEASSADNARVGLEGTTAGPPQVSAYITFFTGPAGRRNRSRVYLPFIPGSFIGSAGGLNVAGQGQVDGYAAALMAPRTIAGVAPATMTISYGVYARDTKNFQVVVNHRTNLDLGTQIRRSFAGPGDRPALPT